MTEAIVIAVGPAGTPSRRPPSSGVRSMVLTAFQITVGFAGHRIHVRITPADCPTK